MLFLAEVLFIYLLGLFSVKPSMLLLIVLLRNLTAPKATLSLRPRSFRIIYLITFPVYIS